MSSIVTNTSAMTALATLKAVNASLNKTQSNIANGTTVSSAADNSGLWALTKAMEADVNGLKTISSSLSLGESTVAVARGAAETVTDLLGQMKDKIIAAQEENVDRGKIQTDINALKEQIKGVVEAAQFNGLNLVKGQGDIDVLASLSRKDDGSVTTSSIKVQRQDLSTGNYQTKNVFTDTDGTASADGDSFVLALDQGADGYFELDNTTGAWDAGDSVSITIGGKTASYTVSEADAAATSPGDLIAIGLKNAIESLGIDGLEVDYDSSDAGRLTLTNGGDVDLTVSGQFRNAGSGGLALLGGIDVETDAAGALANIETMIQTSIDAAAAFGSAQAHLKSQSNFVDKLMAALTAGIGALIDTDMEEESAKLQALQVQQQLAVQALAIANQSPQTILSLFR